MRELGGLKKFGNRSPDGLLPVRQDVDSLYGPRTISGEDSYVPHEINVSSVIPFPPQAPAAVARLTLSRLQAHRRVS